MTRVIIHHGKAGRSIDRLVKEYEFKYPYQYWMYIIDSYYNGHKQQAIELFNAMRGENQKAMLLNCENPRFVEFIILNL